MSGQPRHPNARKPLGHTATLPQIKLHPDLLAHLQSQAEANYCTQAEWMRRLIIADKAALDEATRLAGLDAVAATRGHATRSLPADEVL